MDLLGRKARRRAHYLEARLNGALQTSRSQSATITDLFARLNSRESLLRDLVSENTNLASLVENLHFELEQRNAVVKVSDRPVHMSEEEQDLKWQLDNNNISLADYENLLQELDFQNAGIDLDPDYRQRPDLTY